PALAQGRPAQAQAFTGAPCSSRSTVWGRPVQGLSLYRGALLKQGFHGGALGAGTVTPRGGAGHRVMRGRCVTAKRSMRWRLAVPYRVESAVALLAAASSLTPSLLPKTVPVQGVVTGLAA